MSKRVAIYSRVSTDRQSTANQVTELRTWADRCGYTVVEVFEDKAISGAKGRDQRPAFDRMLKGAVRREFDIIAVWSSDRLGRSLPHLIEVLQTIRDTRAGLYIHTQSLDTTTPAGRAMFGMLTVFGEFEREMIIARVNAGLERARREGKRLGRPTLPVKTRDAAIAALRKGASVRQAVKASGASVGAIGRSRRRWERDAKGPSLDAFIAASGAARHRWAFGVRWGTGRGQRVGPRNIHSQRGI